MSVSGGSVSTWPWPPGVGDPGAWRCACRTRQAGRVAGARRPARRLPGAIRIRGSDDAIGPEPGRTSPEARADWHIAFTALGKVEGIDLRGCTDGQLRLRRAMYERETSWAPRYVGEELRLARLQARTAWENSVLAARHAEAATDPGTAERHRALAGMWQSMHGKATQMADMLAVAQETRRQWEALTEPTRRAAIAADLELRRRHPGIPLTPLRSAEPEPATSSELASRSRRDGTCGSRKPSTACRICLTRVPR